MCQQSIWDSQTIGNKTIHCNDNINDTVNETCANNQFEALLMTDQLKSKRYKLLSRGGSKVVEKGETAYKGPKKSHKIPYIITENSVIVYLFLQNFDKPTHFSSIKISFVKLY